jgi:hypothetical protein
VLILVILLLLGGARREAAPAAQRRSHPGHCVFGVLLLTAMLYLLQRSRGAFMDTLPQYTVKIGQAIEPVTKRIQKIQENAGKPNPAPTKKGSGSKG